ncbi:MAG: hypothetical protein MR503_01800 [Oscillospiraceae bacterium]|nr:hypothetical protein [Oscillospiraceae bacterium]
MDIEFVTENQKRINKLLSQYEKITRKLLDCDVDDILILTEKRKGISQEITKLDNQIRNECSETPKALEAYLNKCDRSELTDDLKQVFDLRQEFNGIAFGISSMDPEIIERINLIRDDLVLKIKKNNSGQNAKAAKYAKAGMSDGSNFFVPENKKLI